MSTPITVVNEANRINDRGFGSSSPALETTAARFNLTAVTLQSITIFDRDQLSPKLLDAGTAIRGSHDMVKFCRSFLITEVASRICEATESVSFSKFKEAALAVDIARQLSYDVVQSLDRTKGIVKNATDAVAKFSKKVDAAKLVGQAERLMDAMGRWMTWSSQGEATVVRGLLKSAHAICGNDHPFKCEWTSSHCRTAVEDEHDRFLTLTKDLNHVATELQSITQFKRPPASGLADDVGMKRHVTVLERFFLDALAANIQSAEGVQAMEALYHKNNARRQ